MIMVIMLPLPSVIDPLFEIVFFYVRWSVFYFYIWNCFSFHHLSETTSSVSYSSCFICFNRPFVYYLIEKNWSDSSSLPWKKKTTNRNLLHFKYLHKASNVDSFKFMWFKFMWFKLARALKRGDEVQTDSFWMLFLMESEASRTILEQ